MTPAPSQTLTPITSSTAAPSTDVVAAFTPVEEVLTPPPNIDTSGWLTYRDDANGFELKYPPDAMVKKDLYEPNPLAESTELGVQILLPGGQDDYIFARVDLIAPAQCVPLSFADPKLQAERAVRLLHAPGADFFKRFDAGAAASNYWDVTTYMTHRENICVTLDGVVSSFSSGVLATPPGPEWFAAVAARKAADTETFTAIIATFRWLN